MGEINRDGHLDLDPKSRLGLEEVPDSSRHFRIGRDGHLDCRDKKVREGWDFSSINPDFLSRNSRKLAKNIRKSRWQYWFSLTLGTKIGESRDIPIHLDFWTWSWGESRSSLTFTDSPPKFKKSRWPTRPVPKFGINRDGLSRPVPKYGINRDGHPDLDLDPTRPDLCRDTTLLEISRPYLMWMESIALWAWAQNCN